MAQLKPLHVQVELQLDLKTGGQLLQESNSVPCQPKQGMQHWCLPESSEELKKKAVELDTGLVPEQTDSKVVSGPENHTGDELISFQVNCKCKNNTRSYLHHLADSHIFERRIERHDGLDKVCLGSTMTGSLFYCVGGDSCSSRLRSTRQRMTNCWVWWIM